MERGLLAYSDLPLKELSAEKQKTATLEHIFSSTVIGYLYQFPDQLYKLCREGKLPRERLANFFITCRLLKYERLFNLPANHLVTLMRRLDQL